MNFDTINQNNNGLLRFRSAPSSVLQSLTNEKVKDLNDRFISNSFQDLQEEVGDNKLNLANGYSLNSQMLPYNPRQSTSPASIGCTSSYSRDVSSSIVMDNLSQQTKMGSSLLRQNSSPAGLFSHLYHHNGYGGNYGAGKNGDLTSSSSMFKGQMSNFPSGVTSLGTLSRISEIEPENVEPSDPFGSWEHESSFHFNANFTVLKRELDDDDDDDDDDDGKLFGVPQNEEIGNHPHMLSQHLSLPKMPGERAAMENLLHFQDSVPCKIRAKRGCATHPRSIAERLRRTRISERMRKLQELVPNMEKQTNTADMLDLAVDYIKGLQKEYKTLSDLRAKCRCSAKFIPKRTV